MNVTKIAAIGFGVVAILILIAGAFFADAYGSERSYELKSAETHMENVESLAEEIEADGSLCNHFRLAPELIREQELGFHALCRSQGVTEAGCFGFIRSTNRVGYHQQCNEIGKLIGVLERAKAINTPSFASCPHSESGSTSIKAYHERMGCQS